MSYGAHNTPVTERTALLSASAHHHHSHGSGSAAHHHHGSTESSGVESTGAQSSANSVSTGSIRRKPSFTKLETHEPGKAPSIRSIERHAQMCATGQSSVYLSELQEMDEETLMAQLNSAQTSQAEVNEQVSFIINLSLAVNVVLFIGKVAAFLLSGSLSVAASVLDSFLDLLVQAIIYYANKGKNEVDKARFPAGKSRFEPVGIIICASLMCLAAIQLVGSSISNIYTGIVSHVEDTSIDLTSCAIIISVIVIKALLWHYCQRKSDLSDSVETLASDHFNDVLSNIVAAAAIILTMQFHSLWWSDAVGCIIISLYIAINWYGIATEKIAELVGRAADEQFIENISKFVNAYHPACLELDIIRAYHFGMNYLVELEVILPEDMYVREAHDVALALQQAIERMDNVERAFVHVDYRKREIDEHDPTAVAIERLDRLRKAKEQHPPQAV